MQGPLAGPGQLERSLSLPLLVLYGLGTTIGAGIYALIGEVAGSAGTRTPLAFVVAGALAALTGLGYAELTGRYPKAAGEAVFVDQAFGIQRLTRAMGLAVATVGLIAAAAITTAFAGYADELVGAPRWYAIVGLVSILGVVAVAGVRESVLFAGLITLVEIVGLLLVVGSGLDTVGSVSLGEMLGPPATSAVWAGVLGGGFVAFFAFLGFEDIDAVAEETKQASKTLPAAILWTLAITAVVYVAVAMVAVSSIDPELLGSSDAPMADLFAANGGNADVLAAIGGVAMVNGALVQLVMFPRVIYGLARNGNLPAWLGKVDERTHTPIAPTVSGALLVAILALALDVGALARLTSGVTLTVFALVNVALLVVKRRHGPTSGFQVPSIIPALGAGSALLVLVVELL
jgi:APA family basic amino acid/polyamine antiporter